MGLFNKAFGKMFSKAKAYMSEDFKKAIASGVALVAMADGEVTDDEKAKFRKFIEIDDRLSQLNPTEIIELFNKRVGAIEFSFDVGKINCKEDVIGITEREDREMLVAVITAIGKADGILDKEESSVIKEICSWLGVSHQNYI